MSISANKLYDAFADSWRMVKKQASALVDSSGESDRLSAVRSFVSAIVESCWRAHASTHECAWLVHPNPVSSIDLSEDLIELHGVASEALLGCSLPEQAYAIGSLYTTLLPDTLRAKDGVFYTPLPLIDHLVAASEQAGVSWQSARVLDPACGCGLFLLAVASKMHRSLPTLTPGERIEHLTQNLSGMEIDSFSAWMSQVFLEMFLLRDCIDANQRLPNLIYTGDTLSAAAHADYDLVIGNPPYGKVTLDKTMRLRYQRSLYGHANLYGLFTDYAVASIKPDGVIAFVTPTSFLGGQYFKALRSLMIDKVPPVIVDFVNDRAGVFEDVLQETVLTVYRRSMVQPYVLVGVIDSAGSGVSTHTGLGSYPLTTSGPWLFPRTQAQASLIKKKDMLSANLKDLGYEVVTGQLVWNRHKPQLKDMKTSKSSYPIIWAESVTNKGFSFSASKRNHAPYIDITPEQDYLCTHLPCIVLQRTTSTEQSKRLICAVLPQSFLDEHGGVVVENHLNMVRPLVDKGLIPEFMAFIMNSAAVDLAFRCISGSVAVSAYELEHLPFPAMPDMLRIQDAWLDDTSGSTATALLNLCYGL